MKRVPNSQVPSLSVRLSHLHASELHLNLHPLLLSALARHLKNTLLASLGIIITYITNVLCFTPSSQLPSTFQQPQPTSALRHSDPINMGNYAVKGTKEPEGMICILTTPYSVTNKTVHAVPDSSLEQHIEELNNEIKLRESSLASRFHRTTTPKNQISCASIVAAINNRSHYGTKSCKITPLAV